MTGLGSNKETDTAEWTTEVVVETTVALDSNSIVPQTSPSLFLPHPLFCWRLTYSYRFFTYSVDSFRSISFPSVPRRKFTINFQRDAFKEEQ